VIFGDTTRAVASIATAVQTRKSLVSIAMMALRVGIELVVSMAGLMIVKDGGNGVVFGNGIKMAKTAGKEV
jgi:hypothetical protein